VHARIVLARQLHEQAAGLGQRFDDQHARHDRLAGEMPLEERFVYGHVFERAPARAGADLEHAVDEQERIAVRQHRRDGAHVQRQRGRGGVSGHVS
jgi:hypothetical protein